MERLILSHALQHDKGDIDYVDSWNDRISDESSNGGWGIYKVLLNRIGDQLTLVLFEELE
jgi:hypothetical protein